MQIGQVTLIVGNLHQGIYLLLQGELYHGSQDCRSVLPLSTTEAKYIAANEAGKDALVETVSPRIGFEARRVCS